MERIEIINIPRKILVIKPSSLGDVVHSLPFLYSLSEHFPFAKIHWVIARGIEGVLEGNPMVSKLWIINKDRWKNLGKIKGTLSEMGRLVKGLKDEAYDIVIDLQGLMRSGLIAKATGAPIRIGFKEAREGSALFYTHRIEGGRDVHAVDRYLKVVQALGGGIGEVQFPLPLIKESEKIRLLRSDREDYIVIVPGARWETKKWPAENFVTLASLLQTKSIIVGGSAERSLSEKIQEQSKGKALSMAGETDIMDLIWLIRGAKCVVTSDSGPMHIAAACGIPVVAIFGPTSPARTGPYGTKNIILKSDLACAPCYKRKCGDLKCMKGILVEQVFKAVTEAL
jgi:heptosyltransferase I